MLCIESLLALEAFQALPTEKLEWACDRAKEIQLAADEFLLEEGDEPNGFFILVCGKMSITRSSEGVEMPIGQQEAPAFFGEISALTEQPHPVSMRAATECNLYQITCEDFLTLLHGCRDFERSIFRTMQTRTRGLESFLRSREKMAALGTLSAGLAHELNNPAAALVRALRDVVPSIRQLEHMNFTYGQQNPDLEHTKDWQSTRDQGYNVILNQTIDAMTLSDREDELLDWLEDYGVEEAWKLTEPLASAGIETAALDRLTEPWRNHQNELRDQGVQWLAMSFDVMSMIKNGLRGAERISDLVTSMKSYSHMDRGAQQLIDIHSGLEDTLKLFSFKLKHGVRVVRQYDCSLPKICAYGSELNQVWTNLIDNAIAAMGEKGILEITTCRDGNYVRVEITDSGSGIDPEIQTRIFEPFFTTKDMGQGSGLGLDAVSRIIQNRHEGIVTVMSEPGQTCFSVCLPMTETPSCSAASANGDQQ
ncbi:MAG: ATP-binding protein [Limnothrix sp.]